jgi:CRP-like cAMP-binding protein
MQLVKISRRSTTTGERLCTESAPHERLIYLLDGEVEISSDGETIATAQRGNFLGEMSFLTQGPQEADVVAKGQIEYLAWDAPTMARLKRKKPVMYTKMLNVLGVDLINKLRVQRDTIMAHQSLPPPA